MNSKQRRQQSGITLLELMIVVAIIGILGAVALPVYNNYIDTGAQGALTQSISTMEVFQRDFRLRNGTYVAGSYTNGALDANLAVLGWDPSDENVDYVVTINGGTSYQVTATSEAGHSLCLQYPGGDPCP